ncbi:Cerato-platanin [Suillus occidentalis]|nr:Cerato-platanin [Suillus occidentalis]
MKFTLVVALLSAFALPVFGDPAYVTWDTAYSDPSASLATVSCSDGKNGLLTKGYTTFGHPSLHSPTSEVSQAVSGTPPYVYTTPSGHQTTVYITAVDNSYTFNVSPHTFDDLTDGTGFEAGKVKVRAVRVSPSKCGMPM